MNAHDELALVMKEIKAVATEMVLARMGIASRHLEAQPAPKKANIKKWVLVQEKNQI